MNEQDIFLSALQLESTEERQAFIKERCGADDELRKRLEALLQAHAETGNFLANPAIGSVSIRAQITEDAGTIVGPYKLLQRIGEGGFGVVYMAEQAEPVRRKVALKIIKPGMDTKDVIARFESERQALALMDHPNIARVLDAGATNSGRPYFVMELVKGVPITDFCDKNHLSVEDRMNLFIPVCLAVQHAHHKGIIHRDIKPSNVMVTLHDGKPVPKVIDFGVAKATSQQLTQKTLFTAYGQMIGTPLYMSPEQAEMSGLDIDTRSDIYSLGVLLYELLTGTTPIEQKRLREAGFAEMQRLIRDIEAPRPSTRLSSLHNEASVLISTNRGTDSKRLSDLLRGDVDWIVMKALEKDRQRRYDTPNALADDIQRFLKHEAIIARPPSTAYRVQKFIQRNKGLAFAGASIMCALLLGAVVSTGFALYANSQLDRAVAAESRLQGSLSDAQQERKKAIEERDRAVKAEAAQEELTLQAEQSRKEADAARMAELLQRQEAERQRDDAQRLKDEAIALTTQLKTSNEEQRRSLYASDMNLLRIEAQQGNLKRMREILMAQLPIHGEEDLRGFEWNYWYRFLNQAQVLQKFEDFQIDTSKSAIIPGGAFVALTARAGDKTEIRETASGAIVGTLPLGLSTILINRPRFSATGRSVHGSRNTMLAYVRLANQRDPGKGTECTVYEPTGEKYTFVYPSGSLSHVSFLNISRDGRFVAALGNDVSHRQDKPAARLLVWNVDSQELVLNQVQSRELNRMEFSPDGSMVVAYLCHGTRRYSDELRDVAVVMDVATGEERGIVRHNDDLDDVYWLPDQQRLLLSTLGYSGANRLELLAWAVGADLPQRLSQETMPNYIKGAISPDGRLFAVTGHSRSSIRLIDTSGGHVVHTLHNEATTIHSLTFSEDGQSIIACSGSGEVLKWGLSQNADLFALRAKPLRRLAASGYTLSPDQSLLAVAYADGGVAIRTKDGQETILRPEIPNATSGTARLQFSQDQRYLAHQSNIGPDGRSLKRSTSSGRVVKNGYLLELYDLQAAKKLWQVVHETPTFFTPAMDQSTYPMEFDVDQSRLVVMEGESLKVMTCRADLTTPESVHPTSINFRYSRLVRVPATGQILLGGLEFADPPGRPAILAMRSGKAAISLVDALTHKTVRSFELPLPIDRRPGPSASAVRVIPSPDGIHACVLSRGSIEQNALGRAEVWNLQDGVQVLDTDGTAVEFSADGTLAAIMTEQTLPNLVSSSASRSIRELTVWNILQRRRLCRISLGGNQADQIRFSPDGNRLLTLHGKQISGDGGAVAQGKLWDLASGREILAMPIADVNLYHWDLIFDASGDQLTSFLFGKAAGSGSGGNAVVYDATPMSPQDDAQFVARHLVETLSSETPLVNEMVTEIDARKGLPPLVRETAMALVTKTGLNADRVADTCRRILVNRYGIETDFQKALRWTEALQQMEPDTLRTRVLHGAACVRCGHMENAIEILKDRPEDFKRPKTRRDWTYHRERNAMLLVALVQSGAPPQVYGPLIVRQLDYTYPANSAEEPDSPQFSTQEGSELVPMSTVLFVAPSVWHRALQSPPNRLFWFARTLILPYV